MARRAVLAAALLLGLPSGAALAQSTVPADRESLIYYSIACGERTAPGFVIVGQGTNGRAEVRVIPPRRDWGCPNGEPATAARGVFYRPRPGFRGQDRVDNIGRDETITITVR